MAIVGKAVSAGGGGSELNIAYGLTPPADTSKLWVRMKGEPKFVESTNSADVSVGEFTHFMSGSELAAISQSSIDSPKCGVVCGNKIFVATNENWQYFNAIDLETKVISKNYTMIPNSLVYFAKYPAWCSHNSKMYLLGGRPSSGTVNEDKVRIFDSETNTWTQQPYAGTTLSSVSNDARGSTCVYNNVIYVFGQKYSSSDSLKVFTFDTVTYESTSFTLTPTSGASTINSINNSSQDLFVKDGVAYFIVYTNNSHNRGLAYKIDLNTKTVYTYNAYSINIPDNISIIYSPGVQIGDKFYILGFYSSNTSHPYIFEVTFGDTECSLVRVASLLQTPPSVNLRYVIGSWNNSVYALCYFKSSSIFSYNELQKMSYQFPLQNGRLVIQEGGLRLPIVNTKEAKIYMTAQKMLLGNSSNVGEEVTGYLYDTAQQKWLSLDGTPYTV